MRNQIKTVCLGMLAFVSLVLAPITLAQDGGIRRAPSGHPDLSGTYDVGTQTPMQRSTELGDRKILTNDEAAVIAARDLDRKTTRQQDSDPNRSAPPQGGDGSTGASGNVGGYNTFWIDNGTDAFQIDGQYRTSIIIDPPNGRMPPVTDEARAARRARFSAGEGAAPRREGGQNDGTAYWLNAGLDAPGPYDNMEDRSFAERCLLTFGSTSGPTMLPTLYNNYKRIVQSEDTVLIHIEMVHEARIIRMNAEHDPANIRKWLGDSIGWWEGDTLVVETINFTDMPAFSQGSRDMKVTERFRMESAEKLIYSFTVEDPTVWTAPFTGEYSWPRNNSKVFEYACHEANYALEGIMKGARLLEAEFRGEEPAGVPNPTR
jgi:hypothetical protein